MSVPQAKALTVCVLVFGLAFGSAAHRIVHGIEYTNPTPSRDVHAHAMPDGTDFGIPISLSVEETICILCEVSRAQLFLTQVAWHASNPGSKAGRVSTSIGHRSVVVTAVGRAPPGQI